MGWEPIAPGPRNRTEIAALQGLILSALATLALVLAALGVQGCGGERTRYVTTPAATPAPQQPAPAPASWRDEFPDSVAVPYGEWRHLPAGQRVWVPAYLTDASAQAVLDEVASTEPMRDPRYVPDPIQQGVQGPPIGWEVVICTPGVLAFGDR